MKAGDPEFARRWAERTGLREELLRLPAREVSTLTYIRLLMAENRFPEARLLLERLGERAREGGLVEDFQQTAPETGQFVSQLLEAYSRREAKPNSDHQEPKAAPGRGQPSQTADLPEPLSEQELKVLRLHCAGLSNQEISAELVIGLGTAKWHVHNVYSKLGETVLSGPVRDQAALHGMLSRIRDLGLPLLLVRRADFKLEEKNS